MLNILSVASDTLFFANEQSRIYRLTGAQILRAAQRPARRVYFLFYF
jgi:hypothetical protein